MSPDTYVEYWEDASDQDRRLFPHGSTGAASRVVALQDGVYAQQGTTLLIGDGGDGEAVKTATVDLGVFRSVYNGPCSVQATATIWVAPCGSS